MGRESLREGSLLLGDASCVGDGGCREDESGVKVRFKKGKITGGEDNGCRILKCASSWGVRKELRIGLFREQNGVENGGVILEFGDHVTWC